MSKKNANLSRQQRAAAAVREQQAAEARRRWITLGAVFAVLAIIIGGGFFLAQRGDNDGAGTDDTKSANPAAQQTPTNVTSDYGIVTAGEGAKQQVVIYEDLQCPACAQLEEQLGEQVVAAAKAGKFQLEYRIVSFLDQASTNEYSSRAMNAAVAVFETAGPEVFQKFHDQLYANQPAERGAGFENDKLIEMAVKAGADEGKIRPLVEGKAYADWIAEATKQMEPAGVTGTPAIFIDGKKSEPQDLLELLQ